MSKESELTRLSEVVRTLRSEEGCPWDRVQTNESLKPCVIEEAYEIVEAIDIASKYREYDNLREELGDMLLQIVMHAQIAEENGWFALEDVERDISDKMIRRHPHVFGTPEKANKANWEEIKRQEKEGTFQVGTELESIPKAFPALLRAAKVAKKAEQLYGIREHGVTLNLQDGMPIEEKNILMGKLLYSCADYARQEGMNPEAALAAYIDQKIKEIQEEGEAHEEH